MRHKIKKVITSIILFIILLTNVVPVLAFNFENGQVITLKKDHECISVLKVKGKDMLKGVTYVVYEDPETGIKQPAFCVEPEDAGIGTGAGDSYDVSLQLANDPAVWRALYKGYMGSSYTDWNLACDDDLYYATKTAIHCIAEGESPVSKYEVPNRVGWGEDVTLEEVKTRGELVLAVAQEIYEYGIGGTEDYSTPTVSVNKQGELLEQTINGIKYLIQNYYITGNREIDNYNVSINNFPTGTKILNNAGTEASNMTNSAFKIAIPISQINDNVSGQINITNARVKTYPVFYAKSYNEDYQDYVTYANDLTQSASTSTELNINAYTSSIELIKMDADTKVALKGVQFNAKYADTNESIGDFTTDEDGKITITGLRQGTIILTEKSTLEEYELNENETRIELEYNQAKEVQIYNSHKKGNIKVVKVDGEDNQIKLEGVEFDLIDTSGTVVAHLITNEDGEATVSNINTGEYILRETKTHEEYKLSADQEIKITWKDTLELTIENIKKKGQIQVVKADKEDNQIRLQGVKFKVLDLNENEIEEIETDENGEAFTMSLPIGTYYIQEVETDDKYVLNEEKLEVQVLEDETTSIIVQNEKVKGQIRIIKISEDENEILKNEAGSPIAGAKFNIYTENNILIEQIETNEEGVATSSKLEKGMYYVQEVETGKWYILNDQKFNVEITENNQVVELEITNKSQKPEVDITKAGKNVVKSSEEMDYSFTIKNSGNTDLTDFTWYDILPSDYGKITKIQTGTFNQDVTYSIYYKTNLKDVYMVLKKNLSSKENNYVDLTNLYLEEGEKITEIKICFGKVLVGFESIESPHIYMQMNENLENDTIVKNYTILEGYNQEYKVSDEDTVTSIVYNVVEEKKLPRTGF